MFFWLCWPFFRCVDLGDFHWLDWAFASRSVISFLRKSGALLAVLSKSCTTSVWNSFRCCDRSCGTNFAATCFMPRSSIKVSEILSLWSLQIIFQFCHCKFPVCIDCVVTARTHSKFLGVQPAEGLLQSEDRFQQIPSHFSFLKHWYNNFIWASLIKSSSKAFLIIWIVSMNECPSLKQNLMQIHWSICLVIENPMGKQCTTPLNGIHCWLSSSKGEWLHACAVTSPLTSSQVTLQPCD